MGRAFAIGAVVAIMTLPASAIGEAVPVLAGPWNRDQEGYGHVKPSTVYNGGDSSGLVKNIRWSMWGSSRAIGEGLGLWIGPKRHSFEGTRERVRIVLFQLGYCHGKRAYEAIEWYFPQHGERFSATNYIEACTGEYHG
jgi:hypothetical protein